MDWLDHNVVWEPGASCLIGDCKPAAKDADTFYAAANSKLYPNYCEFCRNNGMNNMGRRRFDDIIIDALQNQLGLNVYKGNKRTVRIFNLRLRSGAQEEHYGQDSNFPSPLELSQDTDQYQEFYRNLHPEADFSIRNNQT